MTTFLLLFKCFFHSILSTLLQVVLPSVTVSKYFLTFTPLVTNSGDYLRDLAPGEHSSEETSQRWQGPSNTVSDLTSAVIEPHLLRQ